jgi:Fur family iron response transcriptional regulator
MSNNISQLLVKRRENAAISHLLKTKGIKPSKLSMDVANVLFSKTQHLTVKQIQLRLAKRDANIISKEEVKHSLRLFCSCNLIREVFVDSVTVFYDSNTCVHSHFYNVSTGQLVDIPVSNINIYEVTPPQSIERNSLKVVTV